MVNYIPRYYITHTRRVQTLYKKMLRDVEDWVLLRHEQRIQQRLIRDKFDQARNIKDPIMAQRALHKGETYYTYTKHPEPFKFTTSYEGTAWERAEIQPYDPVLDYWHPLEKAQYPDYFAKRELRKKEFVEWYNKKYGKPHFHEYGGM